MRISDSEYLCDKCGGDCGNGGVVACLVVSDLDHDNEGMVKNYHFCRDREEDDKTVKGCASKVMSAANLAFHLEKTEEPPKKGKKK